MRTSLQGFGPVDETPLISATGIDVSFSTAGVVRRVLEGVDVEVAPGDFIAMTGRTGSGKSTLLRVLAGVLRPTHGILRWNGKDVAELSDSGVTRARRGFLGYVPQDAPVVEGLEALEHIILGCGPMRGARRRRSLAEAEALAHDLGLDAVLRQDVRRLSGGERQRVALATVLAGRPRVLVLDEPTSALDEATTRVVLDRLRRLLDDDGAVIAATHDPLVVCAADRIVALGDAGRGRLGPAATGEGGGPPGSGRAIT